MNLIEDIIRHPKLPLTFTVSASHNRQSTTGGVRRKMSARGVLKSPCHRYLPGGGGGGGAYYVPCQKRLCKMKYGFDGSIFKCHSWLVLAKQHINA